MTTDQTPSTNTLDETLQILEVSEDTLNQITNNIGWGELTQFTNTQVEQLQAISQGHLDHGWSYVESHLRKSAQDYNVGPEEFDLLSKAIAQAGKDLGDYLTIFDEVLQRFCNGDKPEDCVLPWPPSVEEPAPEDKQVTDEELREAAKVIPNNSADSIASLIKEMARNNAKASCDTIAGFAEMGAVDQEHMKQIYINTYQATVCEILQSTEFKARIEAAQTPALGGNQAEQKKMLAGIIFGNQIQEQPLLLNSSAST